MSVLAMLLAAGSAAASPPAGPRLAVAKVNLHPRRTAMLTVGSDGSRPLRLAGGEEDASLDTVLVAPLSWSPGGEELAFSGIRTIYLVRADGGGARPLNLADAESPVYAPEGQTMAFSRKDDLGVAIWVVDLVSGAQRRVVPSRRGLKFVPSSFSPDGSTLLATRIDRRAGEVEPVAIELESGKVTRVLGDGREPVYSPDGTKIALFREVGERRLDDLFVLDLASGKPRRMTRTPSKERALRLLGSVGRADRLLPLSRPALRMGQRDRADQRRRKLRDGGPGGEEDGLLGCGLATGPGARGRADRLLASRLLERSSRCR